MSASVRTWEDGLRQAVYKWLDNEAAESSLKQSLMEGGV